MKKKIALFLETLGLKTYFVRLDLAVQNTVNKAISRVRHTMIPVLVKLRSKNGYFAVDIDSDWIGLGARIVKTLEILLYCEEYNLKPAIRFNYQERANSNDYFRELFSSTNKNAAERQKIIFTKIRDIDELHLPKDYNNQLSLAIAKPLFEKYFSINRSIVEEVDLFAEEFFKRKRILGVHYRGTDKAGEAKLVTKENLKKYIRKTLAEEKTIEGIFVSTDDANVLHYLSEANFSVPVFKRADAFRSSDGLQFHRKKGVSKSIVNRDAFVNLLLLSRCDILVKTASILSDCSVIFNPSIDVRVVSIPYAELTWWPAKEINKVFVTETI